MDYNKLYELGGVNSGYWGRRLFAQAQYCAEMCAVSGELSDKAVSDAVEFAYEQFKNEGSITKNTTMQAEKMLEYYRNSAKAIEVLCVAHAHIDMNWQWGYDETVSITIATVRTMLELMRQYDDFKFSQSQASVYSIIEKHAPKMFAEIKQRVKEGRWEISASTWVEPDKNMPSGESLSRHILYTKNYLSNAFDLPKEYFSLDFEPDTFGHNANVPEILSSGGVKYYYHCRGNLAPAIYRWQSQSGKSVLVFREPTCYNWTVRPEDVKNYPAFANQYKVNKILNVYGVGDHGGGATRADIETIKDMNSWPAMPVFKFSTYVEYFDYLKNSGGKFDVITGEQNAVFSGCYSSQSRIKAANRKCERLLFETEYLSAATDLMGLTSYCHKTLEKDWQNVLFSHFHDILPGSGMIETREYCMGKAQEVYADCGVIKTESMRAIADSIDFSKYSANSDTKMSISFGAGVGFDASRGGAFAANYGSGGTRAFVLFNNSAYEGEHIATLQLWDYEYDLNQLQLFDAGGNELKFANLGNNDHYWGHWHTDLLVACNVPAYGYQSVIVKNSNNAKRMVEYPPIFQRQEKEPVYVLENKFIRAEFNPHNSALISLENKENGTKTENSEGLGYFRFINEDASLGMTSWETGKFKKICKLTEDVKMSLGGVKSNLLRQQFEFEVAFGRSNLRVTVLLDSNSKSLKFDCVCDFAECGDPITKTTPRLEYYFELNEGEYIYDIPFGIIKRKNEELDHVGNSFAFGHNESFGLAMSTDSKYSFRNTKKGISANFLRASYEPDPFPECARHEFCLKITPMMLKGGNELINNVRKEWNVLGVVSARLTSGTLPMAGKLLTISSATFEGDKFSEHNFSKKEEKLAVDNCATTEETNTKNNCATTEETNTKNNGAVISAIKKAEDGSGYIFRFYNSEANDSTELIDFNKNIKSAYYTNINEDSAEQIKKTKGSKLKINVSAYSCASIKVIF